MVRIVRIEARIVRMTAVQVQLILCILPILKILFMKPAFGLKRRVAC